MWSFYFRVFWFHMGFFFVFGFVFFDLYMFIFGKYKKFEKRKRPGKGGNKFWKSCCFLFLTSQKNQKKKKKSKNKRGYTWRKPRRLSRLVMKYQNDKYKSWRTRMYMIGKISDPFLIDKRPIRQQYLYLG